MLEDSYVGIYDLERVSFHFKAITGEVEPNGKFINCMLFFQFKINVFFSYIFRLFCYRLVIRHL